MRVAIIGSSTFPVVQCAVEIAQFIKTFPPDTEFLTRGAEGFDRFAAEAASIMGYKVTKFPGKGGAFNFERDVDIVRLADRIEAFYDADRIGEGGTGHIVEKALDAGKPTHTYIPDGRGLLLLGSDDGEGAEGHPASQPRGQAAAPREGPPQPSVQVRGSQEADGDTAWGRANPERALPDSSHRRFDRSR